MQELPRGFDETGMAQACRALGVTPREVHGWLDTVGGPRGLLAAEPAVFRAMPGIGEAMAGRLHAAIQLGAACVRGDRPATEVVSGPEEAAAVLVPALSGLPHEELHALYLDRRHRVLGLRRLTVGSDRYTVVDPPQVYRPAVALGAAAVVLAHNHPTGDPTPSWQDRQVTERVGRAGGALGIVLSDHLVVGAGSWTSMARLGWIEQPSPAQVAWTA